MIVVMLFVLLLHLTSLLSLDLDLLNSKSLKASLRTQCILGHATVR